MERFIDRLIDQFDSGQLSRREFCETMAVATAVLAAGGAAANAAPQSGFTMLGVNHISYSCPDYRLARDFYRDVFGMQVVNDKGMGRANLAFGPAPDNGGNFLVVHNPGEQSAAADGGLCRSHLLHRGELERAADQVGAGRARSRAKIERRQRHHARARPVRFRRPVRQSHRRKHQRAVRPEGDTTMQAFAATKLDDYTKGKISRRQLLEIADGRRGRDGRRRRRQAAPAPNRALKAALVNHISYQCPDFHRAADWYSRVFNMEQVTYPSEPTQIGMPFGRRNQKPLGVTADDVPTSYIVVRTRNPNGTAADKSARRRGRGAGPRSSMSAIRSPISTAIARARNCRRSACRTSATAVCTACT